MHYEDHALKRVILFAQKVTIQDFKIADFIEIWNV